MEFGLQGQRVRLVPLDWDRHGECCYRWVNNPELTATMLIGDEPMTLDQERDWFAAMSASKSDVVFAIETLDGRPIGVSALHQIDWRNGTAISGSYIAELSDRNQGYATEAVALRTAYAFETLGLRLLYSAYFEGNEASRRMQERIGYKAWGVRERACWKRGRYINVIETRLFADEWRARQPR